MNDRSEDITLKQVLDQISDFKSEIFNNRIKIFVLSILFSLIAVLYSFITPPIYQADITFVTQTSSESSSLGSLGDIATSFGFSMGAGESTFSQANVMELFRSRRITESTLLRSKKINNKEDVLLIDYYINIHNYRESSDWIDCGIDKIDFKIKNSIQHDSIITCVWQDIIEEYLRVDFNSKDASVITLSFISEDQYFAKVFVETIIEEMSKFYVSYKTKNSRHTLSFIQDRADSVYNELELTEEEYAKVQDINKRIVKASGRLKELQLMRQVQVLNTMYLELIKNLEVSKLTLLKDTPIIEIMDVPILPLKDQRLDLLSLIILFSSVGFLFSISYIVIKKVIRDAR